MRSRRARRRGRARARLVLELGRGDALGRHGRSGIVDGGTARRGKRSAFAFTAIALAIAPLPRLRVK